MARVFSYKTAAFLVAISAVLHLLSPFTAGAMTQDALMLFPFGVLYLLFAWGLSRGMRWLAYVVFIILLAGTVISFGYSGIGTTVPAWLYSAIVIANLPALAALFACLWRSKNSAIV